MRCTPAHLPVTGMPSTCIGDTVLYITANPKLHKSDNCTKMQEAKLEFVYVRRGGCVGVSWDFDDLSTKTRHAPYVWSSKHPPAGCTLDGNVIVTDQKDTLLLRVASPSPRNNWGPTCTIFPFFIVFVKDSILGNWLQKRAPGARKIEREVRAPKAQEFAGGARDSAKRRNQLTISGAKLL